MVEFLSIFFVSTSMMWWHKLTEIELRSIKIYKRVNKINSQYRLIPPPSLIAN